MEDHRTVGQFPTEGRDFLFSKVYRLPPGVTQPPVPWVPGFLPLGVRWWLEERR